MPSNDDLLFAEHVVKAGFLTQEEIDESLSVQKRMEEMGVAESLRNVLVKRGALREGDAAIAARNAGLRTGGEPIPGYALEARLGAGAMGSVYKAFQKGMKRHVAIKILRRDLTDDPRQVERLQREAALVGKLDHPNIVRGLDSGEKDGLVWFCMELVDGETLRARITRLGRIPPDEAVRITRQIAEALVHASSHGVVHRDIKPGNILLAKDGTPRLTDYGLAKGEADDALTQLDATLGTPQYISPEQARNPRDADIRSDIYSLGATLYAMLAGEPPFAGETMAATLTKVLYERPKPLSEKAPEVTPALGYVVERMMAKDRRHRYQTPDELLSDLRELEAGRLTVPAGFKGDISEFVETRRRRGMWLVGAGLVAAAVALAAGVLVWEHRAAEDRRRDQASHTLESLRKMAGPSDGWNGVTIQKSLAELERLEHDYPGTPAAGEALVDIDHWTAQEAALRSANELELKAGDPAADWPRVVADVVKRLAEWKDAPDASVARRRLVKLLEDVRIRREIHAGAESEAASAAAARLSIDQAAQRFASLAESLKTKYFGDERSALVDDALATEKKFRAATAQIDAAFADYDRAATRDGELARGEFRALEARLEKAADAASADERLAATLAALPPAGARVDAVAERREQLRKQLVDGCAAAWEKVRRGVEEKKAGNDFDGAAAALDEFAGRALAKERGVALEMRDDILRRNLNAASVVRQEADLAWTRFIDAVGRRDYARAREALDDLATIAPPAPPANPASELVVGGRRLLDLFDEHLAKAFRARLTSPKPLDRGVSAKGMRYQGVRDVRIDGREMTFRWEGGPARVALDDVVLDDVVYYADLRPTTPERALVLATARLSEFRPTSDAADGVKFVDGVIPLVEAARASAEFQPIVARLAKLAGDLADGARAEIKKAEERARATHGLARTALDQGRYDSAWQQLKWLLELPSYSRTDYVKSHREEIAKERDEASRGRRTSNYAAHFPGGLFTQTADGAGELFIDFESPALATADGRKMVGLVDGRTEIASRPAVVADRPSLVRPDASPRVPLVFEHVFAWRTGDGVGPPRDVPISIDCPFAMRSRISVSFLYKSDAPLFLAVSIGGVTAGVLSADGEPYGGRGVEIWNAKDLDRPDKTFDDRDERHRTAYLLKHPEALKREGDKRFFCFEPGRAYRVEFVKDERKASLFVDGQLRSEADWRPVSGSLEGKITLASFSAGDVDDLRITGILDPEWLRGR
jgi:tRNA A-37 threonylcarbamoyl transferase component Bud32